MASMGVKEMQEKCSFTAREATLKALTIDENAKRTKSSARGAIVWYDKAIGEFEKGIALSLDSLTGDERERALRLREKMQKNLQDVRERKAELENKHPSQPYVAPRATRVESDMPPPASARGSNPPRVPVARSRSHSANKRSGSRDDIARKDDFANKIKQVKGIDSKLANMILDQVLDTSSCIKFSDIAGLETAKRALEETVILPAVRPELFTGLRSPSQGLLLFGPPGNGKTLLAKAVANEAKCVFFNISASALTSKWVGEAEKLVKALFVLARHVQPAVVFIDEIDSILCERKDSDNEVARRLKTEFLLQFDGVSSSEEDRILVMGATNRPFELDEAILRRFPKRIFIPLPDEKARMALLDNLLSKHGSPLSKASLEKIVRLTDGYSCSDLTQLAKDAAYGPIREIPPDKLKNMSAGHLRQITLADFENSLKRVRASTNVEHMKRLIDFNAKFGDLS